MIEKLYVSFKRINRHVTVYGNHVYANSFFEHFFLSQKRS